LPVFMHFLIWFLPKFPLLCFISLFFFIFNHLFLVSHAYILLLQFPSLWLCFSFSIPAFSVSCRSCGVPYSHLSIEYITYTSKFLYFPTNQSFFYFILFFSSVLLAFFFFLHDVYLFVFFKPPNPIIFILCNGLWHVHM
jgi:hypothetical protein